MKTPSFPNDNHLKSYVFSISYNSMLEIRRPSTNQPQRMVLGELEQNSNMILVRPSTNHTEAAEAKFISKKIVDYDRERTAAGR